MPPQPEKSAGQVRAFTSISCSRQLSALRKFKFHMALIVLLLFTATLSAGASTLLYDNGADNHLLQNQYMLAIDRIISGPRYAADGFTLSTAATLTSVVFAEDTADFSGLRPVPLTIDWCIGTSVFSGSVACGTAALKATATGFTTSVFTNYVSSFNLPNLAVPAGAYYLTLGNGTDTHLGADYWGTSATSGGDTQTKMNGTIFSTQLETSFQIYGTTSTSVPEPGTLSVLASAVCAIGAVRRKLVR